MKNKSFIVLLVLIFSCAFKGNCQDTTGQYYETAKYKMTEYLLSCQSIAYSLLSEQNLNKRADLATIGYHYYNYAYQNFIILQNPSYGKLTNKMDSSVSIMLTLYEKTFSDVSQFNDSQQALKWVLALYVIESLQKKTLLPDLWKN